MDWETRRLLELAGIKRRRTPDHLLLEEEGDDDEESPFDNPEESPFGDSEEGAPDGDGDGPAEAERVPPEELSSDDIEKYGSPRFLDLEMTLKQMYNDSKTSGAAAAQHLEVYPGEALADAEDTPAKEPEEDDEEKNESFKRFGPNRNKWLLKEANRLLLEAEEEGSSADEFDMERFATELANYLDVVHQTEDIESGIFNAARQMILNNHGEETEKEFVDMLAAVSNNKWSFVADGFPDQPEIPVAIGTGAGGGGGA